MADSASYQVLIVDDDRAHAQIAAEVLQKSEKAYACTIVNDGESAQRLLMKESFDVVLLDLMLPDIDGMKLLEVLKQRLPDTEVLIMTGYGSVQLAVDALKAGAFSFLEKPLGRDLLRNQVAKALEHKELAQSNRELRKMLDKRYGFEGLIGNSPAMKAVFERIRQVAPTEARVLISGANGSGKELVARAIHHNSERHAARLVPFNCGAISGDLLQSELFGHVKGAFTGADRDREGKFEYADGGTLFLDEIGEMPLEAQVKLLRVLETGEIIRLGANQAKKVNVRLVSATNKDLREEVKKGRFREDLYFRLKVIEIALPALHERGQDIVLLAESFLREFTEKYKKDISGIEPEVGEALMAHNWPGNVRELRNTIEEMVVLTTSQNLDLRSLPAHLQTVDRPQTFIRENSEESYAGEFDPYQALVGKTIKEIEANMVRVTLEANKGNRERSAKMLGVGERTLYRKIKEYQLDQRSSKKETSKE